MIKDNRQYSSKECYFVALATIVVVIGCMHVGMYKKKEEKLESGRVTNESKTAPKMGNSRRLAPRRSFVRYNDTKRILAGRAMAR